MALLDSTTRIVLNDRRWNFTRKLIKQRAADGTRIYGTCDDPKSKNKSIVVDSRLSGEIELDTIIHELLHAASWEVFDDDFVDTTATSIARILHRLGYRKLS